MSRAGFTLLEILIALFIFTILSMILVQALHQVIVTQSSTESSAERLRDLQLTFLVISRDVEQAVDRPIIDASQKEAPAFVGTGTSFTFTHTGFANPTDSLPHSVLQRSGYAFHDQALFRMSYEVLDQAPTTKARTRQLLKEVTNAQFSYLDQAGQFQPVWPVEGKKNEPLPRAVKVDLTLANWGMITQLYVIAAEPSNIPPVNPQGKSGASQSDSNTSPDSRGKMPHDANFTPPPKF